MDEDDPKPKKPAGLQPRLLDRLSLEELAEYIGELQAEIARVEVEITRKERVRQGAEAVFRKN